MSDVDDTLTYHESWIELCKTTPLDCDDAVAKRLFDELRDTAHDEIPDGATPEQLTVDITSDGAVTLTQVQYADEAHD